MVRATSVSVLIPGLLLLLVVVVSMRDPLPGVTKAPVLRNPFRCRSSALRKRRIYEGTPGAHEPLQRNAVP